MRHAYWGRTLQTKTGGYVVSRNISRSAVAAATIALVLAGCGGSSKSNHSSANTGSPTSTVTTATQSSAATNAAATTGQPLSKAQYEAKLAPLLNDRVGPALRSALANGGAANPQKLATAISLIRQAHDAMAKLNPPTQIADLHRQAVASLGALADDMSKMRSSLQANDKNALVAAVKTVEGDALKIESIGSQMSARGF